MHRLRSPNQRDRRSRFHRQIVEALVALRGLASNLARTEESAADLVQDTCLRALERERSLADHENLGAWLARVMRNLHIDGARSPWQRARVDPHGSDVPQPIPEPLPLWRVVDDDDLAQAMPALSAPLRRVWELRGRGLDQQQIARHLRIPGPTVATRMFRARIALRKRLSELCRDRVPGGVDQEVEA